MILIFPNSIQLFTPIKIGNLQLKNRIVMPAMCTEYASSDGSVTTQMIAYYRERARGGVGLIITEMGYVNLEGKGFKHMLGVHNERMLPGLRKLAAAIHNEGGKIAVQIAHVGRRASSGVSGFQPVAPSPIPNIGGEIPRELSREEIEKIENDFAEAALRVKEAGFDGVELHMAHGYLINQFLSAYANRRTDEYGGSLENRFRLALNIVAKVKEKVGQEYPVLCKINGSDYLPEGKGVVLSESIELAKRLEKLGVNAITVSGGIFETGEMVTPPAAIEPGIHVKLAELVKTHTSIPIITIGKINDPAFAERILVEKRADLVAMGRALIADPYLPVKFQEGRHNEIRKCIGCVQGCTDRLYQNVEIRCLVNPEVGREEEVKKGISGEKKNVLIVGGGPAGMEAAIDAAKQGHLVTVFEKSSKLGGQLNLAGKPPHKKDIEEFLNYLENEIERLRIGVRLKTEADTSLVKTLKPDTVILATGAEPLKLPFHVNNSQLFDAWEILQGKIPQEKQGIIIGGGMVGCETAEFLAKQGKELTILEMLSELAQDMPGRPRKLLLERLSCYGVNFLVNTKVLAIDAKKVHYERKGIKDTLEAEFFINAIGSLPNDRLKKDLSKEGIPFIEIGDCVKPRKILEAIHEAYCIFST